MIVTEWIELLHLTQKFHDFHLAPEAAGYPDISFISLSFSTNMEWCPKLAHVLFLVDGLYVAYKVAIIYLKVFSCSD
jgi:hypothetical protein